MNRLLVPFDDFKRLQAELEAVKRERDELHEMAIAEKAFTAKARPALDALARFTANLNLQDHPVHEQRKQAEVVRNAMATLQPKRAELRPRYQHAFVSLEAKKTEPLKFERVKSVDFQGTLVVGEK